jgi:hypothetical protein
VHSLGADGALNILDRNTLGAGYELTLTDFKTGNDFVGHLGRASFSRQLTPVMTGSLSGSLAHRDVADGTKFNIYNADVGLRRDVSAVYSVEGRFGYNITDATTTGESEGFTFSLKGDYTGKLVRFSGTSSQSIQETFLERDNVGLVETRDSTMQVQYDATDSLTLTARGRLAQNRFLQSGTVTGQQRDRKDLLLEGTIEVAWKLTRLLSLTAGYTYTRADSNLQGLDYQSNRVRLGLTAIYE